MLLSSNAGKTYKIAVVPSEFTSNIAEFGAPKLNITTIKSEWDDTLPDNYTRVYCLENTADGQYIDTGYIVNEKSNIRIRTILRIWTSAAHGAQEGDNVMVGCLAEPSIGGVALVFPPIICVFRHGIFISPVDVIGLSKDSLFYLGQTPVESLSPGGIIPNIPFNLFRVNGKEGTVGLSRVYSFSVTEDDVPVVNLIPCIDNTTGQTGMYDTIRRVFLTDPDGKNFYYVPMQQDLSKYSSCRNKEDIETIDSAYYIDNKEGNWVYPLESLEDGESVFNNYFNASSSSSVWLSYSLISFNSHLPNLRTAYDDTSSWSSLTGMFCANFLLKTFIADMPKLTHGTAMFIYCQSLSEFKSDLSSLVNGYGMFGSNNSNCTKLDLASVQNIANTINDISEEESDGSTGWGELYIGISAELQSDDDNAPVNQALAKIRSKGWTVVELYSAL